MLRFEVSEAGQGTLPAIDADGDPLAIGSGPNAVLRLPVQVARSTHVRIEAGKWVAIGDVIVDGKRYAAGEGGALGASTLFELGTYRVRVTRSPTDAAASSPQRTESIARELVRAMLGVGSSPTFEIEKGPSAGAKRELPPPESTFVIGRGDESDWTILDEDLSRAHCEVRRSWEGATIRDRGSKNGTILDGERLEPNRDNELRDGATVAIGNLVLRYRDPAQVHLVEPGAAAPEPVVAPVVAPVAAAAPAAAVPPKVIVEAPAVQSPSKTLSLPFVVACVIAAAAAAGLAYVLAT